MSDRTARLANTLALCFIWPGLLFGGIGLLPARLPPISAFVLANGFVAIAIVWNWRHYVRWNVACGVLTALATAALIAVSPLHIPLFSRKSGWLDLQLEWQMLVIASIGLWGLFCCSLWWGPVVRSSYQSEQTKLEGTPTMTPQAVRFSMALALIPICTGLSPVLVKAASQLAGSSNGLSELVAGESIALIVVGGWWIIWRRQVIWTRGRRLGVLLLAVNALIAPAALPVAEWMDGSTRSTPTTKLESLAAIWITASLALWIAGTSRLWRTDDAESMALAGNNLQRLSASVTCPECGYSLRGLTEARCPECGWSTTVDDLVRRSLAAMVEL